jgi:hypothetical protein
MKKNKVINLFGDKNIPQNTEVKYARLLEQFMQPFAKSFESIDAFEYQEDIFNFSISAWNLGNMKSIIDASEFNKIISLAEDDAVNYPLLKKMVANKAVHFKEFTNFLVDFEFHEKKGVPTLTVLTKTEDFYMTSMLEETSELKINQDDFEENYINRSAISLKPLQPFIDWHNAIYSESSIEKEDLNEVNIYLINNSHFEAIEKYLKRKFDHYFMMGWSVYL